MDRVDGWFATGTGDMKEKGSNAELYALGHERRRF